ncbi:MAG: hypothetical protein WBW06_13900 [Xanthobacteraceae bacterium]
MGVGFLRAAVSVALLATSCACAHAQTGEISGGTVKIGVLTDMTGVFSDLAGGRVDLACLQKRMGTRVGRGGQSVQERKAAVF